MKKALCLIGLLCCIFFTNAQQKRALVIGINKYDPGDAKVTTNTTRTSWPNLDGCVNDAQAIRDMITTRYGFPKENIIELYEKNASRANIEAALEKLIKESEEGDIVFIFYAGHGSKVINSLSVEKDKIDESIVPADVSTGAKDIRDKELSAYLNRLLDKKVTFTGIFDCCHSGSIGRGYISDPPKTRDMAMEAYDAKDPTDAPKPEGKGALMISAAQDFEFAKEQTDELGNSHGAFTLALLKAMNELGVDASVKNIFASVRAIMKYYGKTQEPVLAGPAQRQNGTLFGIDKGSLPNKQLVAIIKVSGNSVELQGGLAMGLNVDNILKKINGNDSIQVVSMNGANKSMAKLISGKAENIKPGDMFEVVNWVSSAAPSLKLFIPESKFTVKQIDDWISIFKKLADNNSIQLIEDIAKQKADVVFFYDKLWKVSDKTKGLQTIGQNLNETEIKKWITGKAKVYFNVPPSESLVKKYKSNYDENSTIKITTNVNEADYMLVGRIFNKSIVEYALVQPLVMVSDSAGFLPKRTSFNPVGISTQTEKDLIDSLVDYSFRIVKLKTWISLSGPKDQTSFPFELTFKKYQSNNTITSNVVRVNDTLTIYFTPNKESAYNWDRKKRYVYAFSIDSKGAMNLLYPAQESGSIENLLPAMNNNGNAVETELSSIIITPPSGTDHYFMLTTDEPIVNLSVFEQEGVLTRGNKGAPNPVLDLINNTGTKTRSRVLTKLNWGIYKVILQTKD